MVRLPEPRDAQQLCRLRALRVQRARERVNLARVELDRAAAAVKQRQHQIATAKGAIAALADAVVTTLAPALPRWSTVTSAQRERLIEHLEREEFALAGDEQKLEEAQERLQEARAGLTRALGREGAVRDLYDETLRARAADRERRTERELEDQGRPLAASQHR